MNYAPNFRLRTRFYLTWARVVFSDQNIDYFDELMEPFDQNIGYLQNLLRMNQPDVLMAIYNKTAFQLFFDWFYPEHFKTIIACFERYFTDPEVSVPVLKMLAEFAHNKAQRIEFSTSSPNGIILFKEVSVALSNYSRAMFNLVKSNSNEFIFRVEKDAYRYFLKSLSLAMETLTYALRGNYVNFGIFSLYNDDTLATVIASVISLTFSEMGLARQITVHEKVSTRYFQFVEVLFRNHIDILVNLDAPTFSTLFGSLLDGLYAIEKNVSSLAAAAIDDVATYHFTQARRKRKEEAALKLDQLLQGNREPLKQMLQSLFTLVLFEGSPNLWSFSRPLLGLIFIENEVYNEFVQNLFNSQPAQHQEEVQASFARLMEGVRLSLEHRNRDCFTQNLVQFTGAMKKIIVKPAGL
jgi:exportin-7